VATIIDSLLVTLGLDDKPYKKGAAEADRAQKQFKDNSKKTNSEITDQLKAVTRQVALMVVGFESLRGAIGFLAGINNADAALGRLAANTGTNVHELNRWGNAVELVGGDAKEAQSDVANLAQSITQMKAGGEVSPILLLMQRLGVAIFDAEGKTRNLFDILKDAGTRLRQFNRPDAFQLGRGAGISEGSLNLLLQTEEAQKRIFAEAERNNNMNEAAAERAAELQKQWRDLLQSARAFGRELLETVTPAAIAFFNALKPAGESLRGILKGLNEARVGETFATAINGIASGIDYLVKKLPAAQQAMASFFEYTIPKMNTATSWFDENVSGENAHWYVALKRAIADVIAGPAEAGSAPEAAPANSPGALARVAQQQRLAAFQQRQATAGGGGTVVQIDHMEVHTQATDAEGVATDMQSALTRKISQADAGLN